MSFCLFVFCVVVVLFLIPVKSGQVLSPQKVSLQIKVRWGIEKVSCEENINGKESLALYLFHDSCWTLSPWIPSYQMSWSLAILSTGTTQPMQFPERDDFYHSGTSDQRKARAVTASLPCVFSLTVSQLIFTLISSSPHLFRGSHGRHLLCTRDAVMIGRPSSLIIIWVSPSHDVRGWGGHLIKLKCLALKSLPFYYFTFPPGHFYLFWVTQPQTVYVPK